MLLHLAEKSDSQKYYTVPGVKQQTYFIEISNLERSLIISNYWNVYHRLLKK